MKGVKDSSYGVLIKPDLLRQAVVPTFILANLALTSRARTFSSTSLPRARARFPHFPLISNPLFRCVRQPEIYLYVCVCVCVCSALKRCPRFSGEGRARDSDPVRLLKKLRDRKGSRHYI